MLTKFSARTLTPQTALARVTPAAHFQAVVTSVKSHHLLSYCPLISSLLPAATRSMLHSPSALQLSSLQAAPCWTDLPAPVSTAVTPYFPIVVLLWKVIQICQLLTESLYFLSTYWESHEVTLGSKEYVSYFSVFQVWILVSNPAIKPQTSCWFYSFNTDLELYSFNI